MPPDIRPEWRTVVQAEYGEADIRKIRAELTDRELYCRRYSCRSYMLIVREKVMTLEEVRAGIDAVDTQMKPLFLKRMEVGNM